MYYNDYEDYMRSVLGYNRNDNVYADDYNSNFGQNYYQMPTYNNISRIQDNVEDLFPDIYKILNPMVCKICKANTRPITRELVDQMTEEIYTNIEADDINVVNINIETKDSNFSRNTNQKQVENRELKEAKLQEKQENRNTSESRQRRPNNPLLRDLIRILILNQLLGGNVPGRPPVRPPFPGPRPPVRPPFPGPGPRPGTRDFGYDEYLKF